MRLLGVVFISGLGMHLPCRAQCGLHAVPEAGWNAQAPFRAGLTLRRTGITHDGAVGVWSEFAVNGAYRNRFLEFGFEWPLAMGETRTETHIGSGNPAATLALVRPLGASIGVLAGLQVAFPIPGGLGGDHGQGTAFAGVNGVSGNWSGTASAGFGLLWPKMTPPQANMEGMHHGSSDAMHRIGHAHENREWIYRVSSMRNLTSAAALGLALDGRHPVGEVASGSDGDFLVLEPSLRMSLGGTMVSPAVRLPVSPDRLVRWGLELSVSREL
jgi:hypothetical protein